MMSKIEYLDYAGNNPAFAQWLEELDRIIMSRVEMGLFDLPDMLTRDAFDAGDTPMEFYKSTVLDTLEKEFGDVSFLEERE